MAIDLHQALPYGINVRLTQDQRVFLQVVAEAHDEKISTAIRRVIDEAIAVAVEDPGVFDIVESWEPDPAWAARHGADE